MTVFNSKNNSYDNRKMFLDEDLGIQRYEQVKYKQFEKFTTQQLGFFWQPEEVNLMKDNSDFKKLSEHEQHIFISNLRRQIMLDSVQGRSPNLAFLPITSLPEVENWIENWAFNETIHSKSYTHIIRNIFSNPSVVFDEIEDIEEIIQCGKDISRYYDNLINKVNQLKVLGEGTHTVNGKKVVVDLYDIKKALWLTMMSVNVLEGIRFYVSFACSWAFAELKQMEGNAKIIRLICRDENLHLGSTQTILKLLPNDDPDYVKIREETEEECIQMFVDAVDQEMEWAKYLFKDGSMIGLNEVLLKEYIEWIANKRMISVGFQSPYKTPQACPLPWTQKWISSGSVQEAPQEVEKSSYIISGTKQDVGDDTFNGFNL